LPFAHEELRAALAHAPWEIYDPASLGSAAARSAIALHLRGFGVPLDPERLLLTGSTSEAYGYLIKLLCDPGDCLLVPEPSYPLLSVLAAHEAVALRSYSLAYDGAWHIDFASLEAQLREGVKAIVVVSPNNPTGSCLKRDELRRLLTYGVPVISDEVFWAYPLTHAEGGCSVLDAEVKPYPRGSLVFRLDGLSKFGGLPQLKLAWTAVDGEPALVDGALARLQFIADAYLSPSAPVQAAIPEILQLAALTRHALHERLRENLGKLDEWIAGQPISRLHLEAGWYTILNLPKIGLDWAAELLEAGVWLQPGWFFDLPDERAVVVSLLTEPEEFALGVRRLLQVVADRVGLSP
jgi:aspartate/methionine/tyrosine aminotransferase